MATEPPYKTPPYASYASFRNYLDHLRGKSLPSRIDKSVMAHLNYGTQQALMAALRSLGMIGEGDAPTASLELLVDAGDEDDRKSILSDAMKEAYPYLFDGRIDLSRATTNEFHNVLREATNAQGTTIDKASAFFFGLAADSGLTLSPHLSTRKAGGSVGPRKLKLKKKPKVAPAADSADAGGSDKPNGAAKGMAAQLLDKFPPFDPGWPDNIKEQWFAGFGRLMESADKAGQI